MLRFDDKSYYNPEVSIKFLMEGLNLAFYR